MGPLNILGDLKVIYFQFLALFFHIIVADETGALIGLAVM
jgi:hypothetical protein